MYSIMSLGLVIGYPYVGVGSTCILPYRSVAKFTNSVSVFLSVGVSVGIIVGVSVGVVVGVGANVGVGVGVNL
jgi:hypothetical protein